VISIAIAWLAQSAPAVSAPIPASAKAVVDHVDALYRGDIEGALAFVADDVENSVSDLKSNLHFPPGKVVTRAMYASITKQGKLALSWFSCAPEAEAIRCDMNFGTGKVERHFVMRYFASNGPITRIYSWEDHGGKKTNG
jgi:hypothetical protein